jgi:type II secretory pathway component GspD/PulD (secretin)
LNKRLRSRVLGLGMVGTTLLGAGSILHVQERTALAQDKPAATELLDRASKRFSEQQYAEAKKLLQDIDRGQLPEAQRGQLDDLIKKTDDALAAAQPTNAIFDNAKSAADNGDLAQAAKLYTLVGNSPNATPELKQNAKIQLALVQEKQKQMVPQMKALLADAIKAYDQGRLDEAQTALYTVSKSGADLGWQDNAKPEKYQRLIAEKRTAQVNQAAAAVAVAQAPAAPTPSPAPAPAAPAPETPAPAVAAPVASAPAPAPAAAPVVAGPAAPAPAPAVAAVAASAPAATQAADSGDVMSQLFSYQHIVRERAQTFFSNDLRLSTDKLHANDFQGATASAEDARAVAESNRQAFSEAEYQGMIAQVNTQINLIKAQNQIYTQQVDTANAAAIRLAAEKARIESRRSREQQVNKLMGEAHVAYTQQQYQQAAETLQHVLVIDPNNNGAQLFLEITQDRINYRKADSYNRLRSEETVKQSIMNEDEMIPYSQLLIYPEDWPELSRRRQGETTSNESPANIKARERLDQNLTDLSADQQPFERVIGYLRESTNTNIFVNWTALQGAGVDKNTPVSVNLRDVPFRKALLTVLSEVGGGQSNLGYTIDDGVITISTKDELQSAKYQVVRVYDIRDMLVQPDNTVQPPSFNLQSITQNGSSGGSGGGTGAVAGGGQGIFSNGNDQNAQTGKTRDDIVKEIIATITSTVSPDTWRDAGGTIGSLRELNGQLIINQTSDNQTQIYNLLAQLRETRALQIAIESRLLLVDNNFLDDFGFQWGLTLPAGELGANVGTVTINNNTAQAAVPQQTGVPSTLVGVVGGNNGVQTTQAVNSLDISGQILDNFQLNLLLRATQADRHTTTVTSPRVTLFNGQRGYIAVTAQRNFVSNFSSNVANGGINGNGAVGITPTIATLTTGVVLYVEATVSADRRYVVMKLRPALSTLDGIDTFGSAAPVATSNGDTFAPGGLGITGGIIQLPRISYNTVDTMVSIPDGGTLLIGGQKIVGESEIEVGVPVLSKIPGINRLFTNRSYAKDERTLLILVRPKIIIQREEEYRVFGQNFDNITSAAPMMVGGTGGGGGGAAPVAAPAAAPAAGQ